MSNYEIETAYEKKARILSHHVNDLWTIAIETGTFLQHNSHVLDEEDYDEMSKSYYIMKRLLTKYNNLLVEAYNKANVPGHKRMMHYL